MFSVRSEIVKLRQLILCFLIIGLSGLMPVQAIVNLDALHFDQPEQGMSGDLELLMSGTSGNSDTSNASIDGQLNWVQERYINLLLFGYQYGKSNNVTSINKSFIHYRHIHRINETLDWEAFTQISQNEFTRLSYRGLLGGGVRFAIAKSDRHKGFLGVGGFYSKEKTEYRVGLTDDGVVTVTRGNFYFLSRYQVQPTIKWSNVIYYQPRLSEPADFRALLQSKLDFKINSSLNFRVSLDVAHDSQPSQTIEKTDITYSTGLKWHF